MSGPVETTAKVVRGARIVDGTGEPSRLSARLALILATRTVLASGLEMLGVSAPESM